MVRRKSSVPIFAPPEIGSRIDALRLSPDEARWRVVGRLLDEHDARTGGVSAQPSPEPRRSAARAVSEAVAKPFRRLAGKEKESPSEQSAGIGDAMAPMEG